MEGIASRDEFVINIVKHAGFSTADDLLMFRGT